MARIITPHTTNHASDANAPVQQSFHASFACAACAEAIAQLLYANPAVAAVQINYAARIVEVTYQPEQITPLVIEALISTCGFDCPCKPLKQGEPAVPGGLENLAHHVDMASVTMGTAADRMQYEFPSTNAAQLHHAEFGHPAATIEAAQTSAVVKHEGQHHQHPSPAGTAPRDVHAAHGAMGHDMSDPSMARAMEADMRHRFFLALALTIPTVLFSPLAMNTFGLRLVGTQTANWLMLAFSTPVVWWAGWPFIGGAARSLRYRALNMSVLITIGVLAAWGFSLLITLLGSGETFYEAAAMLVTFVLFGHWMEMKSRRGTTDALRALFNLVPPTASVLRDGREMELPTSAIVVGDRIRLRPGDKVPVDGVVVEGSTSIDESLVTGESGPVDRVVGDPVIGGSINRAGSVIIEAQKVGSETVLSQIVKLVEHAQSSKAPGQRLADTAASYLVILAVGSGIITFLIWYVLGSVTALTALTFAISAVVIACPDALGLATPTAIAVGTGLGAKHNILIKDAATLEGLSRIQAVVLDKTGTLTEGKPQLTDVVPSGQNGWSEKRRAQLLQLVAAAEQGSEHPLAQAIVQGANAQNLPLASA